MAVYSRLAAFALLSVAGQGVVLCQVRTPRVLSEFSSGIEELASTLGPAVVQIEVRGRMPVDSTAGRTAGFVAEQRATGSGVIVDEAGYVVTNAHVVGGSRHIDVSVMAPGQSGGRKDHQHYPGHIIGVDKETDLAVLKIDVPDKLPTLPFVDSDKLHQGQVVLALGSPLGLDNTLTVGFVSSPGRQLREDQPVAYVQTDAPINPGNSGGPLLDIQGRIAGINTLILSQSGGSEGIGFAIPSNVVQAVYKQLRETGHVRRGAIGVISQEITPDLASALHLDSRSGIMICDVIPESAAAAAGVESGDILLAINGRQLEDARQLTAVIFQQIPGQTLTLDLLRGKERVQKTVTVMERPSTPASLADLVNEDAHLIKPLGILALTLDEKVTAIMPNLRRLAGVVVAAIPAELAAFNPGLQSGDVIYSFNKTPIGKLEELRAALAGVKAGDPVALLVERDGTLSYLAFELE